MIPIIIIDHNRANCRKDGHRGKGQHFCQPGGSQEGVLSSPRHFRQNVYIHECSIGVILLKSGSDDFGLISLIVFISF